MDEATNSSLDSESTSESKGSKARLETHEKINLLGQSIIPIVTAIITVGVYLFSTYYVSDVELKLAQPASDSLEVHAYNSKGNESVFRTEHFQLPPDQYHFEITEDSSLKYKLDQTVAFGHKTVLNCLPAAKAVQQKAAESTPVSVKQTAAAWVQNVPAQSSVAPVVASYPLMKKLKPSATRIIPRADDGDKPDKPDEPDKPDKDDN